jgi:hypothetical protein
MRTKSKKANNKIEHKTYNIPENLNSTILVVEFIKQIIDDSKDIFKGYKIHFDEDNQNLITFKNKKGDILGSILYNYEEAIITITGEKIINLYDGILSQLTPLTDDEINNSVFKNVNINVNNSIFRKLDTDLKKIGIEEVRNLDKFGVYNKVTLTTSTGNSSDNGVNVQYNNEDYTFFKNNNIVGVHEYYYINTTDDEKIVDIYIDGHLIGKYYENRNLVLLLVDIFKNTVLDFNLNYNNVMQIIIDALSSVQINKINITDFKLDIVLNNFLSNIKEKRDTANSNIEYNKERIEKNQQSIINYLKDIKMNMVEIESYNSLLDNGKSKIMEEINKTSKLAFIENIEFEDSYIYLTYKPTFLPIPNYKSSDISRDFGKRYVYLGKLTFRIDNNDIKLKSDEPLKFGNPHTHASSQHSNGFSNCCFGDGEGRIAILEELASLNISGLAFHLWMWIKTHINESSYVKSWEIYNDRLEKGLPVFDDKGNRILINEPERLKSGEQVKLEPSSCYAKNIEKYKNVVPNEIMLVLKNKSEGKK